MLKNAHFIVKLIIFAYGQTIGDETFITEIVLGDLGLRSIIPSIVRDVFNRASNMDGTLKFDVKVSYLGMIISYIIYIYG